MNTQQFLDFYKGYRKGTLKTFTYVRIEDNGYSKVTTTTCCRLVNYDNLASVKAKRQGQTQSVKTNVSNVVNIIPHVLTKNTNTGNVLVHLYPNKNSKSRVIYKDNNGNAITKEQYEMVNAPRKHYGDKPVVFQIKIENLVEIH